MSGEMSPYGNMFMGRQMLIKADVYLAFNWFYNSLPNRILQHHHIHNLLYV